MRSVDKFPDMKLHYQTVSCCNDQFAPLFQTSQVDISRFEVIDRIKQFFGRPSQWPY